MATQKCPRCDKNGAKGNGNDSHVYVNDRGRVPHAFRIARIRNSLLEAAMKSLSRRILRAASSFSFGHWPPCLCPCCAAKCLTPWGRKALNFRPGIGKLLKTSARLPLALEWDPFVNVHGKTGVKGTLTPCLPCPPMTQDEWSSALGKLRCHDRAGASHEPTSSVGSKYDQTRKWNPLDRPNGERLHWNCGSRLARARRDKGIHAPADSASCATDRLYPEPGGACFIGC